MKPLRKPPTTSSRSLLRYYGGKWRMAPWIIEHFPAHRVYVEPYGGAAGVLLRKQRSYSEVYNEINPEIVNFFRVLRDEESAEELRRDLRLTPFARGEFEDAYEHTGDSVENARRLAIRSLMGFGSNSWNADFTTGFRSNSNRSGTTPAHDWANYADALPAFIERLRGVVIENRDAIHCMQQHDSESTLHYVDPPYIQATRSSKHRDSYHTEMTEGEHEHLLDFLWSLKGSVVLSAYEHPIYSEMLEGWTRFTREVLADGARPRIEVIWMNHRAARAHDLKRMIG